LRKFPALDLFDVWHISYLSWNHGIAIMTIYDYNIVMNMVKIADFKSRLSEHLRQVRRGHTLTIMDRKTPIAHVVPYTNEAQGGYLQVREPLAGSPKLHQIPLPPPLRLKRDIVRLLLEERQGER
jgi:antitoxin (DNA-binding transcriptional repressor) of toxin-antitoxin stability system